MSSVSDFAILFSKALEVAPRVLGHQDRNVLSPTYGVFERKYWGWKTSAVPDASNQYAIYYLALLWSLEEAENPFYHNERIPEWISAGIEMWCKLQRKDGSFDQAFPNEHSVGATSYTLLAVLETDKILGNYLAKDIKSQMAASIEKAGNFLLKNDETYGIISNHLALFAVTFHELWNITQNKAYKEKCEKQIIVILENMSKEGWFKEYEGADPGYMTQCMYYLARLLKAGWNILEKPIDLAIREYLPYFVHPDGSLGGCYGSRNTAIFYPAGLALLFREYIEAKRILKYMCWGINKGNSPSPAFLDLPNAFRLAVNYLLAWECVKEEKQNVISDSSYYLPWERKKLYKKFSEAGAVVVSTPYYYSVMGIKKGGVLKVFDKTAKYLACEDTGYFANMGNKRVATQVFNNPDVEYYNNSVKLIQPFFVVNLRKMDRLKYLLILIFGMTVFRIKFLREKFKQMMVKHLITGKQPTLCCYRREVIFSDSEIQVKDRISPPERKQLDNLKGRINYSTIHMASANYFDSSCRSESRGVVLPKVKEEIFLDYVLSFPLDKEIERNIMYGTQKPTDSNGITVKKV